jgi:acyl dehydratase
VVLTREAVGRQLPAVTAPVTADEVARFAEATGDDPDRYTATGCAPPLFVARLAHPVLQRALDDPDLGLGDARLRHAEQELVVESPVRLGVEAQCRGEVVDVAPYALGVAYVIALRVMQAGQLAATSTTTVVVPTDGSAGRPERRPRERPERRQQVAETSLTVAADAAARYATASGDHNPIHLDPEVARASGLPGVILHGMCTLAMATSGAITLLTRGDPRAVRALRARFSRPVHPGDVLDCRYFATDRPGSFAMAVSVGGKAVLKDAWLTTTPAP